MQTFIVVNNPDDWLFDIDGVEVLSAWEYLTNPYYSKLKGVQLFNLCRSYMYQSYGYYVSLLASSRGHKPLPTVMTMQDLATPGLLRVATPELDHLIQKTLESLQPDTFTLSIYFGRNFAKRYDKLCRHLYRLFEAPFVRANFERIAGRWHLTHIAPISANNVPEDHREFIALSAQEYFSKRRQSLPRRSKYRYDLAILHDPDDPMPPSDPKAIAKFIKAANALGIATEMITKDDYNRLSEFDMLFIRETTHVNHHTYQFARRAESEGLVTIDDPQSILRCTNKVYLAELLQTNRVPTPHTVIVHRGNLDNVEEELDYPMILKQPDSSFSQGVKKVNTPKEYRTVALQMLETSALLIAQEFIPTTFDWRIGVFDHQPLYVCKYYMAAKHWQIIKSDSNGKAQVGRFEAIAVEHAPPKVIKMALKACDLIGDGFYGVDIKQVDNKLYLIEVNDNPNIDAGVEDSIEKDELYSRIMRIMLRRVERRKEQRY
ncbi:RimK family protein [Chrysiogenes arsenatis]|uniref:RimK family protein n=1 Tax=Chrysiogenes arsenatis TaxID=309797 RepID=UPI0003FBD69A|nr:RimK family protein [Chrysiogenes arsenatis]